MGHRPKETSMAGFTAATHNPAYVDPDFKAELMSANALRRSGSAAALPAYRELMSQAIWAEINDKPGRAAFWHAQAAHIRMWVDLLSA